MEHLSPIRHRIMVFNLYFLVQHNFTDGKYPGECSGVRKGGSRRGISLLTDCRDGKCPRKHWMTIHPKARDLAITPCPNSSVYGGGGKKRNLHPWFYQKYLKAALKLTVGYCSIIPSIYTKREVKTFWQMWVSLWASNWFSARQQYLTFCALLLVMCVCVWFTHFHHLFSLPSFNFGNFQTYRSIEGIV